MSDPNHVALVRDLLATKASLQNCVRIMSMLALMREGEDFDHFLKEFDKIYYVTPNISNLTCLQGEEETVPIWVPYDVPRDVRLANGGVQRIDGAWYHRSQQHVLRDKINTGYSSPMHVLLEKGADHGFVELLGDFYIPPKHYYAFAKVAAIPAVTWHAMWSPRK